MTNTSYNKLLDPVSDIITSIESIITGAFGITSGDQRESYKRIHAQCWGIHTLVMDVITSLGIEDVATRPYVYDRFQSLLRPIKTNMDDLVVGYDGHLSEEQELIMEFIATAVDSIEHMVNNLWQYSLVKHNKHDYTPTEFDISNLVGHIQTVLSDCTVPELVFPCRVVGDEQHLKYAFGEIAYNIRYHAYVESIQLSAQVYDNRVDLTIHDTGFGFNCDNMNNSFQPFWQADETNEGFGLGLFLAKTYIEQSRGTISISSEQQVGTLVKISLPVAY